MQEKRKKSVFRCRHSSSSATTCCLAAKTSWDTIQHTLKKNTARSKGHCPMGCWSSPYGAFAIPLWGVGHPPMGRWQLPFCEGFCFGKCVELTYIEKAKVGLHISEDWFLVADFQIEIDDAELVGEVSEIGK